MSNKYERRLDQIDKEILELKINQQMAMFERAFKGFHERLSKEMPKLLSKDPVERERAQKCARATLMFYLLKDGQIDKEVWEFEVEQNHYAKILLDHEQQIISF